MGQYRDYREPFTKPVRKPQLAADCSDALANADKAIAQSPWLAHSSAIVRDRHPDLVAIAIDRDCDQLWLGVADCVTKSLLDDTTDRRAR
jgi:hypothetical protein